LLISTLTGIEVSTTTANVLAVVALAGAAVLSVRANGRGPRRGSERPESSSSR
jgi:hypothetical protein